MSSHPLPHFDAFSAGVCRTESTGRKRPNSRVRDEACPESSGRRRIGRTGNSAGTLLGS
jgi:hypothetical protein